MTSKRFSEFLQNKSTQPKIEIDWGSRREAWIAHLNRLYAQLSDFLSEYVESRQVRILFDSKSLSEEMIGAYSAPRMQILVGASEVVLDPVGMHVIGAFGRVDMKSALGFKRLVLVEKDASKIALKITFKDKDAKEDATEVVDRTTIEDLEKLSWKFASIPPQTKLLTLTEESFLDALTELLGG